VVFLPCSVSALARAGAVAGVEKTADDRTHEPGEKVDGS
jgi:hypothetical protein